MNKKEKKLFKIINISRMMMAIVTFSLCLSIFGAILNEIVVDKNGNKMPVKTIAKYSTATHFSYSEDESINFPLLSDRFEFKGWIYSVGDILMYISVPLTIIFGLVNVFFVFKEVRLRKEVGY